MASDRCRLCGGPRHGWVATCNGDLHHDTPPTLSEVERAHANALAELAYANIDEHREAAECTFDALMAAVRSALATAEKRRGEAEALLGRLVEWSHVHGAALCPPSGCADTYGEGVRETKRQALAIISQGSTGADSHAPAKTASVELEPEGAGADLHLHCEWCESPREYVFWSPRHAQHLRYSCLAHCDKTRRLMRLDLGEDADVLSKPLDAAAPGEPQAVIERLRPVARQHGYALAVHGSLARDIDLVAVPWMNEAADADTLADALRAAVDGAFGTTLSGDAQPEGARPHGRRSWAIGYPGDGGRYIDLSVMPRLGAPGEPVGAGESTEDRHPLHLACVLLEHLADGTPGPAMLADEIRDVADAVDDARRSLTEVRAELEEAREALRNIAGVDHVHVTEARRERDEARRDVEVAIASFKRQCVMTEELAGHYTAAATELDAAREQLATVTAQLTHVQVERDSARHERNRIAEERDRANERLQAARDDLDDAIDDVKRRDALLARALVVCTAVVDQGLAEAEVDEGIRELLEDVAALDLPKGGADAG